MPYTTEAAFRERLPEWASHTNHPVVLISPHRFFQAEQGAIFPFHRALGCVSITCDPLMEGGACSSEELDAALAHFDEEFVKDAAVFAGVGAAVAEGLAQRGYSVLKMGEEPWVDLANFEPKGNRGKGIRAARNQALRAGCVAEEWSEARFRAEREAVDLVYREWRGLSMISLEGGVLSTCPFAEIPGRRYFVALRGERLEAVLIATPLKPGESYYLEDLVYRRKGVRGVQELLTLAAMEHLHDSGAKQASLGLVLLRKLERSSISTFDPRSLTTRLLSLGIASVYNAQGQDLFRKRFAIDRWEGSYLAFRGPRYFFGKMRRFWPAAALAWSMMAMLVDLDPTFMWPW